MSPIFILCLKDRVRVNILFVINNMFLSVDKFLCMDCIIVPTNIDPSLFPLLTPFFILFTLLYVSHSNFHSVLYSLY